MKQALSPLSQPPKILFILAPKISFVKVDLLVGHRVHPGQTCLNCLTVQYHPLLSLYRVFILSLLYLAPLGFSKSVDPQPLNPWVRVQERRLQGEKFTFTLPSPVEGEGVYKIFPPLAGGS